MEEPDFANPPQVTDRRDRVWTKTSPGNWRFAKTRNNGTTIEINVTWDVLEELCGPLTLVVQAPTP